jgi:hypothetical protein
MLPRLVPVLLLLAVATTAPSQEPKKVAKDESEWVSLFNGKDLEGWSPRFVATNSVRTTRTPSVSKMVYSK